MTIPQFCRLMPSSLVYHKNTKEKYLVRNRPIMEKDEKVYLISAETLDKLTLDKERMLNIMEIMRY